MLTLTKAVTYGCRLYVSSNSLSSNVSNNLQEWLRHDVDNNNDYEFQLMRRKLIQELEEIEQGITLIIFIHFLKCFFVF